MDQALDQLALRLIGELKEAVLAAQDDLEAEQLTVSAMEIELNTVMERKLGGGLNFKILHIGGHYDKQETQTLNIALEPNPNATRTLSAVSDDLREAIPLIASAARQAAASPPSFRLTNAVLTLQVGVTKDGSVSLFVEGEGSRADAHSVKLTLNRDAPRS